MLAVTLGADWANRAGAIAFRARDDYVSRIDARRLESGKAWLAFARADGAPFTVDNLDQNQRSVPLGPYYLVWDNDADSDWAQKGAADWPYQVDSVAFAAPETALAPPGFEAALEPGLNKTKAACLTCHSVNGYGGSKVQGDLAAAARSLSRTDFLKWALAPDPASTMPPLSPVCRKTSGRPMRGRSTIASPASRPCRGAELPVESRTRRLSLARCAILA